MVLIFFFFFLAPTACAMASTISDKIDKFGLTGVESSKCERRRRYLLGVNDIMPPQETEEGQEETDSEASLHNGSPSSSDVLSDKTLS